MKEHWKNIKYPFFIWLIGYETGLLWEQLNLKFVYELLIIFPLCVVGALVAVRLADKYSAQQSVHPTDGGHSQADNESKPATISG
jgi:hypothetical protein